MSADGGSVANMLIALNDRRAEEDVTVFGCSIVVVRERIKGYHGRWIVEEEKFSDEWRGIREWLEIEGRR